MHLGVCIYTNPGTQSQFLSGIVLVWIQFSFSKTGCFNKAKEPGQSYYLPVAVGIDEFVHLGIMLTKGKLHTPQSSKTGALPPDTF